MGKYVSGQPIINYSFYSMVKNKCDQEEKMRKFTTFMTAATMVFAAGQAIAAEKLSVYHWFEYIRRNCSTNSLLRPALKW